MAPLRSKINQTFHRINDRMKRHRATDDGNAPHSKQPRTLGTDEPPQGLPSAHQQSLGEPTPPAKPCSPAPSFPTSAYGLSSASSSSTQHRQNRGLDFTTPSTASSMSLEYTHQAPAPYQSGGPAPGTSGSPIDLTGDVWFGGSGLTGGYNLPIDLTRSSPSSSYSESKPRLSEQVPRKGLAALNSMKIGPIPTRHGDSSMARYLQDEKSQVLEDGKLARALQAEEDAGQGIGPTTASHTLPARRPRQPPSCGESDLQTFGQKVLDTLCPGCSSPIIRNGADVIDRTRSMLEDQGVLHSCITCKKCEFSTCAWCETQQRRPEIDLPHHASGNGFKLAWCCDGGRLFLIWALCCGIKFDQPETPPSTSRAHGLPRLLRDRIRGAKAESYKTQNKSIRYGGSEEDIRQARSGKLPQPDPKKKGHVGTSPWEMYFSALVLILPSSARGHIPFDFEPPALVPYIVCRSAIVPKAMELLRNDSIEEIADQEHLYGAVLDFVVALKNHTFLSPLIYKEQSRYLAEEQLAHFLQQGREHRPIGTKPAPREKRRDPEKGQPMLSLLVKLARQCGHFRRSVFAQKHHDDFREARDLRLVNLCLRICALVEELEKDQTTMERRVSTRVAAGNTKQAVSSVRTRSKGYAKAAEELREWHTQNSLVDIDDDLIMQNSSYMSFAQGIGRNTLAKGRMKKILAQLAVLRTSLPEGIYVRHGNSRVDLIKVLMVGPKGTPYENGLFEFDILCPANFPAAAPMMTFRTNGGGRVRFNPNLYEDGKVCLSLLGTWSGQQWDPEGSTLLQVLVSIQAMIFNTEPWYNEPGRERHTNKRDSAKYNAQIQAHTIQHAVLYWLERRLAQPGSSSTQTKASDRPQATTPPPPAGQAWASWGNPGGGNSYGGNPDGVSFNPAPSQVTKMSWPLPQMAHAPPMPPMPPLPPLPHQSQPSQALQAQGTPQLPAVSQISTMPSMPPMPPMPPVSQISTMPPMPPVSQISTMPPMPPMPQGQVFSYVPHAMQLGDANEPLPPGHLPYMPYSPRPEPPAVTAPVVDDPVWGEVIRKHFSANAKSILEIAKVWNLALKTKEKDSKPLAVELQEMLTLHGFLAASL